MRKRNTTPLYIIAGIGAAAALVIPIYATNNKLEMEGLENLNKSNVASDEAKAKYDNWHEAKIPEYVKDVNERKYWQINNLLVEKYNNCHLPISYPSGKRRSEALGVDRIFIGKDSIFVMYNVVSKYGDEYSTYSPLCEMKIEGASNLDYDTIYSAIQQHNGTMIDLCYLGMNSAYNKSFFNLMKAKKDFKYHALLSKNGNEVKLVDGYGRQVSRHGIPREADLLIEVNTNGETYYDLVDISLIPLGVDANQSQLNQMDLKLDKIEMSVHKTMREEFDWMSLNNEYNENYKVQTAEVTDTLSQKRTYDYNDYLNYLQSRQKISNVDMPIKGDIELNIEL